jgi:hypothetical protein
VFTLAAFNTSLTLTPNVLKATLLVVPSAGKRVTSVTRGGTGSDTSISNMYCP